MKQQSDEIKFTLTLDTRSINLRNIDILLIQFILIPYVSIFKVIESQL